MERYRERKAGTEKEEDEEGGRRRGEKGCSAAASAGTATIIVLLAAAVVSQFDDKNRAPRESRSSVSRDGAKRGSCQKL